MTSPLRLTLSGADWTLKDYIGEDWLGRGAHQADTRDRRHWRPATVPGTVHHDLWQNGEIPNPYVGRNSLLCEWVPQRTWVYRKAFHAEEAWRDRHLRLRFEGVDFAYRSESVLAGIDLEIAAGSVVALVGPSGGGKTTLADLIPRFYDVTAGRITIDGHDVRELKLASLRAGISVVTQFTFLFNDTVRANIAYGRPDMRQESIEAAARAANAHDFISRLPRGYDTVVGELGMQLSGGERQRIAIARALLKDAPILILDEATSALDARSERAVRDAIDRLMEGRTTLVIAHRLSTVQRADRIAVVADGRIVEIGTHGELMAAGGVYRSLFDLQLEESGAAAADAPSAGAVGQ